MSNNGEHTTGWWVEELHIQALKEGVDITENIQHFHTDEGEAYPLVFIKATLAHQDESEIRVNGKQAEVYDVVIGAETSVDVELSANQLDLLARQCRSAIDDADPDNLDATEQFFYFRPERREKGDQEFEKLNAETPTRRIALDSFMVTVIRSS
jgi:hypothetical protein